MADHQLGFIGVGVMGAPWRGDCCNTGIHW
ncbi:hypothetical protein SAMN05216605_101570 [Pseudomonas abietaniphila]|uniref:Uncharacterized protein n=1 Tax=Pseudomonas abietaniphila TaxID=89065 RepID=A0A1G7SVJ2_9PSED|nr:hypothetical protein SAMN05216605_101570 [Pseudomonas abietaniphila]